MVHWYSLYVIQMPAAANSSHLQRRAVRKVQISSPLAQHILKNASSRLFWAYMDCAVNSKMRQSHCAFAVVREWSRIVMESESRCDSRYHMARSSNFQSSRAFLSLSRTLAGSLGEGQGMVPSK
jgi:hypothetical protein